MKEADRLARNTQRLTEVYGPQAAATRRVLDRLEDQGFRPRIQEAWRSPADQLKAFRRGTSGVKFGFHNVTGAGGRKESLACDVLDDDHPLGPPTRYLLALAVAARAEGLETGIAWKLSSPLAAGVEAAIAAKDIERRVKVGFDPTHLQCARLTIAQARAGRRPAFAGGGAAPVVVPAPAAAAVVHVVRRGETLSGIARAFRTTLARLLELNPQKRSNPNLIRIGEKIRVA